MKPVELRTARLALGQPRLGDVDLITEYCNDEAFSGQSMTTPWPYERKHAVGFVTRLVPGWWATDSEYTWALRLDGTLIGVIGYRTAGRNIGYWLGAPYRGHGYMREAVDAVLDWIFARGVQEVLWEATIGNWPSLSVAQSAGFTFTGIRTAIFTARDGSHPPTWQGALSTSDSRNRKSGWPSA